jgi:hypothetical protein
MKANNQNVSQGVNRIRQNFYDPNASFTSSKEDPYGESPKKVNDCKNFNNKTAIPCISKVQLKNKAIKIMLQNERQKETIRLNKSSAMRN